MHYLVTAPASEPVNLEEAKAHLRLEHALDDAYVTSLITAARMWAEEHCWRGFVTQTWELVADKFPDECPRPAFVKNNYAHEGFELPRGKLASVASVKYMNTAGVETTLTAAIDYIVDTQSLPGRVRLPPDKSWPTHQVRWDAVRIRYDVGTVAGSVPQPVKQAILLLISQMYENRVPEVTGTIVSRVEFAVNALLAPYRLVRHT